MSANFSSFWAEASSVAQVIGTTTTVGTATQTGAFDGLVSFGAGLATAVGTSNGLFTPVAAAATSATAFGGGDNFDAGTFISVVSPVVSGQASGSYASSFGNGLSVFDSLQQYDIA